jgi:hypothetical protein
MVGKIRASQSEGASKIFHANAIIPNFRERLAKS